MPEHTEESIASDLTQFLTTVLFSLKELTQLAVDEPLLGNLLDSMDVLNLILFIEDKYPIRIEDDEVTAETFASIATVAALVARKLADQGTPRDQPAQLPIEL